MLFGRVLLGNADRRAVGGHVHQPRSKPMFGTPLGVPLHPTQFYEFGAELLVFALLFWRFRRPHRPGDIIGLYLIVSSVFRFSSSSIASTSNR